MTDPNIDESLRRAAQLCSDRSFHDARNELEPLLIAAEAKFGHDSPELIRILLLLSRALNEDRNEAHEMLDASIEQLRRAVRIASSRVPAEDGIHIGLHERLGLALSQSHRAAESISELTEALRLADAQHAPQPTCLRVAATLVAVLLDDHRFSDAIGPARRCVMTIGVESADMREHFIAYYNLGLALLGAGEAEALAALKRSRELAVELGFGAPRLAELDSLIERARAVTSSGA